MNTYTEFEHCIPSRELVEAFVAMSRKERGEPSQKQRTEICLAFHHIMNCWHGNKTPNKCWDLWKKIEPRGYVPNKNYDPDIAEFLAFAKYPNEGGNNPLTSLVRETKSPLR